MPNRDTTKSTQMGKAYEYACLQALETAVKDLRPYKVVKNSSYDIAEMRYKEISKEEQYNMSRSAIVGINAIIEMEPKILKDGDDILTLSLQPDNIAERDSDIRDILIIRSSIGWEIGISVKHNHEALKHSRLSMSIDFGEKWFNRRCSPDYFDEIRPIFDKLENLKENRVEWNQLNDKEESIYVPLLRAFKKELINLNARYNITGDLLKYLIGCNGKDYYKLIHHNDHRTTIFPYNFNGSLNTCAISGIRPVQTFPRTTPPKQISLFDFVPKSKTTLMMVLDMSWIITFRIHNASTRVEPSLKFDIQLKSKPENMFYLDVEW